MTLREKSGDKSDGPDAGLFSKRKFWWYSLVILFVSIILAPFVGQHYDPNLIGYAGVEVVSGVNPYMYGWWTGYGYPPLYLYYSSLIAWILRDFPLNPLPGYQIPPLHMLLIKLPSILSHQAIATTLYYSTSPRFPRCFSYLYLFAPFPIFISAVWGNVDEFCAFFLLLSAIYLYRGKWGLAGLMWGVASSTKIYVFVVAAIIPLLIINRKQGAPLRRWISFVVASVGFFGLVSLPFLMQDAQQLLSSLVWRVSWSGWAHDTGLSYTVVLWAIMQLGGAVFSQLSLLNLIPIGVLLILYSYLILIITRSKHKFRNFDELTGIILVITLIAYVSTMVVNEMNYVWSIPLLLIYWGRNRGNSMKFLMFNLILLLAVMVEWTPLDFIRGPWPAIVADYQIRSLFRYAMMIILGVYFSVRIIFKEILGIFSELKARPRRAISKQNVANIIVDLPEIRSRSREHPVFL